MRPFPASLRTAAAATALSALFVSCSDASREADPASAEGARSEPQASEVEKDALRTGDAERIPTARLEIVEQLRADLTADHHPSDGGGRAWLVHENGERPVATVGVPDRFTIVYEAGPLGVAEGGSVALQVSPFWGWSTPQVVDPAVPGFTEVSTAAEGVELVPETLDQQLLGIEIRGRALAPGEQLRMVYGAGPAGARVDRYAERRSRFALSVDGDGDGIRAFLDAAPEVDIAPGAPARLSLLLPSTARPGETVDLRVAVLDASGSAGLAVEGALEFDALPPGVELPEQVSFRAEDAGVLRVPVVFREPGLFRLRARGPGDLGGGRFVESNPLRVATGAPRLLWGDLHGHSNLSDGTGVPEDYYRYARDVAALDVASLTDHDHWGIPFLDATPAWWEEIRATAERFHEPGRFVTLLAYEWTNWIHGHRHVLYFTDEGEILSSVDPAYDSPLELWDALRGRPVLTVAHHSAGGPIATNWAIPPDPELEPVTEIVSVHGSSEAEDSPTPIYAPVRGNFVRDVLARGYRFGFIGSGDSHDGHPGLSHLAAPSGGLAAILSEEKTREGVLAALRARRVYATNGPRIVLLVGLGDARLGGTVPAGSHRLVARAFTPEPLAHVDVIRGPDVVARVPGEAAREIAFESEIVDLKPGEWVYVRVVQENGGAAWSSPFFVD